MPRYGRPEIALTGEPVDSPHRCQGMMNVPAPDSMAVMIWRVMRSKRSLVRMGRASSGCAGNERHRLAHQRRRDRPRPGLRAERLLDDGVEFPPVQISIV